MSSTQRPPYEFIPEWASRASVGASISFLVLAGVTAFTSVTALGSTEAVAFFSAGVALLFTGVTYGAYRWLRTYGVAAGVTIFTDGQIREALSLTLPLVLVAGVIGAVAPVSPVPMLLVLFPLLSAVVLLAIPVTVRIQEWRASLDAEDEEEPLDRL